MTRNQFFQSPNCRSSNAGIQLLLESGIDKEQGEFLTMIQQSGESLLTLINDILDFSKIEAGNLKLENSLFDIRDCLGDTLRSLGPRAHDKNLDLNISFGPDVPHNVVGDLGRLRQVLVNLVGNAIKFTEHGDVAFTITRQFGGTGETA